MAATGRFRIPILAASAGLGLAIALWLLRDALAPFFLAMVIAYLLAPAVDRLAKRMKRGVAVLLVTLGAVFSVVLAIQLVVPQLLVQLDRLVANVPEWKARLDPWLDAHPWVKVKVMEGLEKVDSMAILQGVLGAGLDLLNGFLHAMTLLLVPVIVYYLLMEGTKVLDTIDGLIPPRYRQRAGSMAATIHKRLGGYIRGQISVAMAMSLLQSIAFQIVGVPYAWILGIVAGVSNVIPYSPYLTALAPALLMAGLGGASWSRLVAIAVSFTVVQKAEALYFTPVWVGRASHLHPLEVLLAILSFGFAFGFVGLVFAVPLMIVFKVVLEMLVHDYKNHPWFDEAPPESRA